MGDVSPNTKNMLSIYLFCVGPGNEYEGNLKKFSLGSLIG